MAKAPLMTFGRYKGKAVDTLPNSYLRYLITQDLPDNILRAAKKKLESSDYGDLYLSVTRHAIDMFSKRLLFHWIQSELGSSRRTMGLATFIARAAQEAWDKGKDVSKHRHEDDGVIKEYKGIRWVFGINFKFPEYKEVITVMPVDEALSTDTGLTQEL